MFLLALAMAFPLLLSGAKVFDYNFADKNLPAYKLSGTAKIAGNMLSFTDHLSNLVIENSDKFNFAKNGTTLMMTCRLTNQSKGGVPNLQLFASKKNSFLLGIFNGKFNFSLSQKGEWPIAIISGTPPPDGEWFHLAAVVRPDVELEQGIDGIQLELYINGARLMKKVDVPVLYPADDTPLKIGFNEAWANSGFTGDIAEISMIDRALSPREITEALKKSKYVKNLRPDLVLLADDVSEYFDKIAKTAKTPVAEFAVKAMKNAALTGADQKLIVKSVNSAANIIKSDLSDDEFVSSWNKIQKKFQLVKTDRLISLVNIGKGAMNYPVLGIYDRAAKRIISAARLNSWKVDCRRGSRMVSFKDHDKNTSFSVSPVKYDNGKACFTITWTLPEMTVISNCTQSATRFEQDLKIQNDSRKLILRNVHFPSWKLTQLPGKNTLFFPSHSGRLHDDPIVNGINIFQASGVAGDTMQHRAYYSEDGFGTYVAVEDPDHNYRRTTVMGMYEDLELSWYSTAAYKSFSPAGNDYTHSGKTVLEVFNGDWFEAAMIYKKFLPQAKWWIKDLPRTSTPKWFRELPATILVGTRPKNHAQVITFMRKYLDVPISVHLVGWSFPERRIWPHFDQINEAGKEFMAHVKQHDVRVIPYSDSIIFSINDVPGSTGEKDYSRIGFPSAVKNVNGIPIYRQYGKKKVVVVCPGAPLWQDYYTNIVSSIAKLGFDGAYHDQQGAYRAFSCFDRTHNHDVNDPASWIVKGHIPMFEKIRAAAYKVNPDFVHTSEDGADPHLQLMDGYTMWRFTEPNHVPAFQAVYAGRIQISGRMFNHQQPGDWDSAFIKFAEQLAYAEQLGWITVEDLIVATPLRTYFKKLAHLRQGLIKYFTEADMLKPYRFENMPKIKSRWGDFGQAKNVITDKIIHSSWQLPDGRIMAIFINTVEEPVSVKVKHAFDAKGKLAICREGAKTPEYADPAKLPEIKLAPYATEVWLYSPADNSEEASKIAALMHKISTFDMGEDVFPSSGYNRGAKKTTVSPGTEIYLDQIYRYYNCHRKPYKSGGGIRKGMLYTYDKSEIYFMNLAISPEVKALEITAAATGKTEVELCEITRKGTLRPLAKIQLKSSNKWMEMHKNTIELPKQMKKGKTALLLKFSGDTTRFQNVKFL